MKKILHIINGDHFSGAERVQDLLGQYLPHFGYKVDFVTLKPGRFTETVRGRSYRVIFFPMKNRFDMWPAIKIAKLIREGSYELVHVHTVRSAIVGALASALAGVPLVMHIHSPASNESSNWIKNKIHVWVERLVRSSVDRFVCVSDSLSMRMKMSGVPERKVKVVKNGIQTPSDFGGGHESPNK